MKMKDDTISRKSTRLAFTAICAAALALPLFADPVQINPADYDCSFNVKFAGYRGTTTLADFPVLVRLSAALNKFNYAKCASGGADLRFADSDGNLIPHEIDTWDTDGVSLVWVKVPSFSKGTVIKAYYGYKGAGAQPAVTASQVWANGYLGVWHMGADSNEETQADSTANNKTLSKASASYGDAVIPGVEGVVGKAAEFGKRSDGKGGYIVDDSDDGLVGETAITLELWSYQDGVGTGQRKYLVGKTKGGGYNDDLRSYLFWQKENADFPQTVTRFMVISNSVVVNSDMWPSETVPVGRWNYNAVRHNGETGNVAQFLNDNRIINWTMSKYRNTTLRPLGEGVFGVGNVNQTQAYAFSGMIDEVRVSSVARSDDWLRASYDMIVEDGFATYGVENDWTKFSHKFQVSFGGYAGSGPLTDFPVLVEISESGVSGFRYDDCLKPNGGDIAFADENGVMLDHEVDTWNTNGVSLVWVKIPSLTAATKITAYYGWRYAPIANPTGVWSSGYLGVWHMGGDLRNSEGQAVMEDATGGGSPFAEDGNSVGLASLAQEGVVGGSVLFASGDGKYQGGGMKNVSSRVMLAGASSVTLEIWAWQDNHNPNEASKSAYLMREVTKAGSATTNVYRWCEASNTGNQGKITFHTITVDSVPDGKYTTQDNTKPLAARAEWNYHAAAYDATGGSKVLLNGDVVAANNTGYGSFVPRLSESTLYIGVGSTSSKDELWAGKIDEVRISSVARSTEWLKATYDTVKNNATFTTYGEARANIKGLMLFIR